MNLSPTVAPPSGPLASFSYRYESVPFKRFETRAIAMGMTYWCRMETADTPSSRFRR